MRTEIYEWQNEKLTWLKEDLENELLQFIDEQWNYTRSDIQGIIGARVQENIIERQYTIETLQNGFGNMTLALSKFKRELDETKKDLQNVKDVINTN